MPKSTIWVPKGANLGSERCESGFRKVRTQNTQNMVPNSAHFLVPDSAKLR